MNNLDHALAYATKKNWRVFPCKLDKAPLDHSNGFYDGTTDPDQIKKWWTDNPNYSIGIACGPDSGFWTLDVDLPDGPKTVALWEDQGMVLPPTLKQKTGGGGCQYLFKWNGTEIRNSSKKIGPGIDIRGNGGYIIVPPSGHPSGGKYEWTHKMEPQEAPEWLVNLIVNAKDTPATTRGTSSYGESALAQEIVSLSRSKEGERNDNLNSSAFSLGQLVGGGELTYEQVEASLYGVALSLGLKPKEARATIASGIKSGMQSPRKNPYAEEEYTLGLDQSKQSKQSKHLLQMEAEVSSGKQPVSSGKQGSESHPPFNLHSLIGEWLKNSTGSFTTDQIDREFCLKTRSEKNNRSKSLAVYKEKNIIKKDKTIKGKWHVIDDSVTWIDLEKADDTPFRVILPFDLHLKTVIPTKSVIVLAGSSNAGKTTFILNTLRLNMDQEYKKVYLMSEMGGGTYKRRITQFGDPIAIWNTKIKATEKSYDFDGTILNHNPDGLTCIDFLEEVDGEYFKIPTSIRNIYDALGTGCALIAIQKKSQSQYGKGGEATREKATLYLTLDLLCVYESEDEKSIFCSLKLDKVKESVKGNMEGKELHFRIDHGTKMKVVMDWTYSSKVNRERCIREYLGDNHDASDAVFKFMTKEGDEVGLRKRDYDVWLRKYSKVDLDSELKRVSEYSYINSWLKKKNWFFQLGAHLDKRERGDY